MDKIDFEKILIKFLNSPFNKQFDEKLKSALEDQGLEYKDGEIVKTQRRVAAEAKEAIFDDEDEKIRKAIIHILKGEVGYTSKEDTDKYVAWLEKQGEKDQIELSDEDKENFEWFDRLFRAESVVLGGREIPQDKYYWFKSLRPPIIKTSMKDNNTDCVINTLTDGADKPEVKLTEKMQTRLERMAKEYVLPNWLKNFDASDVMEAFKEGYKTAITNIYGHYDT